MGGCQINVKVLRCRWLCHLGLVGLVGSAPLAPPLGSRNPPAIFSVVAADSSLCRMQLLGFEVWSRTVIHRRSSSSIPYRLHLQQLIWKLCSKPHCSTRMVFFQAVPRETVFCNDCGITRIRLQPFQPPFLSFFFFFHFCISLSFLLFICRTLERFRKWHESL